jgi:hypothetical protein
MAVAPKRPSTSSTKKKSPGTRVVKKTNLVAAAPKKKSAPAAVAAKKRTSVPPEQLRLYERLIASCQGVDSKSNFGSAYTAVNGNMYSMISKYGVVGIRLPEPEHAEFLEKFKTTVFQADPAWPPNRTFVAVPDDLLRKTATLRPYLELSYRAAKAVRPKPTKKAVKGA